MARHIGLLQERLVIQQRTSTTDTHGGRSVAWSNLVTVWAEQVPIRASERLQAQTIQAELGYRFRIRQRADITPKMRALWTPRWPPDVAQKTLQIHGVIPDNDRPLEFLQLECGEVAA